MNLKSSMENRRSFYSISRKSTIADDKLVELVTFAIKNTPSAFDNQSQAAAILLGANHDKLWNIVLDALRKIVPPAEFEKTADKIASFNAGYGTVLYFNDDSITKAMQDRYPLYAGNFPVWAEQAGGMLQFAVWNLLQSEGLGANLQHYNELIYEQVQAEFGFEKSWRLIAQMPFGVPINQPEPKQFNNIETRIKILK